MGKMMGGGWRMEVCITKKRNVHHLSKVDSARDVTYLDRSLSIHLRVEKLLSVPSLVRQKQFESCRQLLKRKQPDGIGIFGIDQKEHDISRIESFAFIGSKCRRLGGNRFTFGINQTFTYCRQRLGRRKQTPRQCRVVNKWIAISLPTFTGPLVAI